LGSLLRDNGVAAAGLRFDSVGGFLISTALERYAEFKAYVQGLVDKYALRYGIQAPKWDTYVPVWSPETPPEKRFWGGYAYALHTIFIVRQYEDFWFIDEQKTRVALDYLIAHEMWHARAGDESLIPAIQRLRVQKFADTEEEALIQSFFATRMVESQFSDLMDELVLEWKAHYGYGT